MSQLSSSIFAEAKKYLSPNQANLVTDVEAVLERLKGTDHISDYSFLVAPISKAYEGYLKDFFLQLKIIDQYSYDSDRFRVGKTLNPSLRYKRFSVFQKLSDLDQAGEEIAEQLWDAWKHGRNEIFHYFPGNVHNLTREEAENRIYMVLDTIIKSGQFRKDNSYSIDLL
ncbi:hypothetical protein HYV64_05595 [Candidatus Shapirobacteria bacterium]|nr:hypothetical protein [Candidatus Shapirobacteria bacterium]